MKKTIIGLIIFFAINISLMAQLNLIPNYSFEEMDSCPTIIDYKGIDTYSKYWFTPIKYMPISSIYYGLLGESDLYSKCIKNSFFSIPKNGPGYQISFNDSSYAGIILKEPLHVSTGFINANDFIEVKLNENLLYGGLYCFELYYSIAEASSSNNKIYQPSELGVLFSDTMVYFEDSQVFFQGWGMGKINATPQISHFTVNPMDTINWIKYEGTYTSHGGENYIVIGNFENIDTNSIYGCYVYIDAVKLWYCGPDTTPPPKELIIPNVFTPNDDGKNDVFKYQNQEDWNFTTQIYNRWGELIYYNSDNHNWDGTYKGKKVPEGVYFYLINATANITGEKKQYRGTVSVFYNQ